MDEAKSLPTMPRGRILPLSKAIRSSWSIRSCAGSFRTSARRFAPRAHLHWRPQPSVRPLALPFMQRSPRHPLPSNGSEQTENPAIDLDRLPRCENPMRKNDGTALSILAAMMCGASRRTPLCASIEERTVACETFPTMEAKRGRSKSTGRLQNGRVHAARMP